MNPREKCMLSNRIKYYFKKVLLFLFVLSVNHIFCISNSFAITLSWQDCIQKAKEKNFDLRMNQHNLEVMKLAQKQSFSAGFIPHVSLANNYVQRQSPEQTRANSLGISVTENLFTGFADLTRYKQSKIDRQYNLVEANGQKAQLSFDLRNAVAQVLYASELVKLYESFVKKREQNLKTVELLYSNGRENKGSFLVLKALYNQSLFNLQESKDSLSMAKKELAIILGIPIDEEIVLDKSINLQTLISKQLQDQYLAIFQKIEKQEHLPPDLINNNFEVRKADLDSETADLQLQSSKSNFYPTLSLTEELNRSYDYENDPENSAALTLSLSYPLFSGGEDYFAVQMAKHRKFISQLAKQKTVNMIEHRLGQALLKLKRNKDKVQIQKEMLDAITLSEKIANQQYFNSFIAFRDWNSAFNDLIDAELSYFESQLELVMAQSEVELINGLNLFDNLAGVE